VFSAGLALRIRMYVALALNATLLAALLVLAAWSFTTEYWRLLLFGVLFALIGMSGLHDWREKYRARNPVDVERAKRAVERLCALADIPVPQVEAEHDGPPLCWTTAAPGRRPRVHVTRALLEALDDKQLEAALAHELSHIANRDAVLMTLLAAPGVYVLRGIRIMWRDPDSVIRSKAAAVMFGSFFVVPAGISAGFARIVSRHRELAADRGAAMLTGSPTAVTSALLRVSGEIAAIPQRDLRIAAANDLLNLVPVRPERGIRRLWATHPRLTTRVRELERLESRLQAG
jgi:heat shock protein HtpX